MERPNNLRIIQNRMEKDKCDVCMEGCDNCLLSCLLPFRQVFGFDEEHKIKKIQNKNVCYVCVKDMEKQKKIFELLEYDI